METYYLIEYSRHKVPQYVCDLTYPTLREATSATLIKCDSNNNPFGTEENIYKFEDKNTYIDLYTNLINAVKSVPENSPVFFIEPDVAYPEEHFTHGLKSISEEPSFIHANQNFLQQISQDDFRKYPETVRVFSSLSGTRDIVLFHLEEKLKEVKETGSVQWLEPGYHSNGRTYFKLYNTPYPTIESRHPESSTEVGKRKSSFGAFQAKEKQKLESNIAVFCPLANFTATYSVAKCVKDQLWMLSRYFQNIIFVTTDNFVDYDMLPVNVEVRTIPTFTKEIDENNVKQFAINNANALELALYDADTVICHDIIFIAGFVAYNALLRVVEPLVPSTKFLHYIHSAPTVVDRSNISFPEILHREPLPRSKYVCLNKTNIDLLSQMYLIDKSEIVYIPNTIDPCLQFNLHPLAQEIYYDCKIWDKDIVCVYPARLMKGKQPDKLLRTMAEIEKQGLSTFIIFANSYNNHEEAKNMKIHLENLAQRYNYQDNYLLTSEFPSTWMDNNGYDPINGIPNEAVTSLMQLSDIFVLPSVSEGCSIIMLEAAITRNLMILNEDLDTLYDFGGNPFNNEELRAIYVPFGSIKKPRHISLDDPLWLEARNIILNGIQNDNSLKAFRHVRKFYSPDYVFNKMILPLI